MYTQQLSSTTLSKVWTVALSAVVVAAFALGCRVAAACDEPDPLVLQSARAMVEVDAWEADAATVREWTQWMARLERMLPEGWTTYVKLSDGTVRVCKAVNGEEQCQLGPVYYNGGGPEEAFRAVAAALRTPASSVTWLEGLRFTPLAVQVGATPLWEGAHELAESLQPERAFLQIGRRAGTGGILTEYPNDGDPRFFIIAGVYLDQRSAQEAVELLAADNRASYIRKL